MTGMSVSRSGDQVAAPPAGHTDADTRSSGGGGLRDRAGKAPAGAPRAGFGLLLTLSMAQFMVVLDFTIVNVALPSIQNGLHVATTTLQWLVSAYAIAFGGFLLLGGRLSDAYGRARLYRIGLVVFVVASIAGGFAVEPGLEGRGLSPLLTGLCFVPQAAGAFVLSGPAWLVPALGPRRALATGLSIALLALAGAAVAVLAGSLPALLAAMFVLGIANRLSQVSSTLAGTQGPVAARSEGAASGLLTATRQCGSALGVAILSATLVVVHGGIVHRTEVAMFVAAGFALAGLLATRVLPPGPPHPHSPQPHHLFRHPCGGIP